MQIMDRVQAALCPLQSSDIKFYVCRCFHLCSMMMALFFLLWLLCFANSKVALALKRQSYETVVSLCFEDGLFVEPVPPCNAPTPLPSCLFIELPLPSRTATLVSMFHRQL